MPTFLHAADLHIDSPLRVLERKEGAPAQRIRNASRLALTRLVDAAIERRVAFVLLAQLPSHALSKSKGSAIDRWFQGPRATQSVNCSNGRFARRSLR